MNTDEHQQQQLPPLVFVHGFKGSYLVDSKTGSTEWITAFKAFGLFTSYPKLALPLTWSDDDTQDKDTIVPNGPMHSIAYFYSVYGPFLDWAARSSGRSFHPFAWDWRRSMFEAVDQLLTYLQDLGTPCQVVGHSMGGLVTYAAMLTAYQRGGTDLLKRLFHSALFVGTPFLPGNCLLEDSIPGSSTYNKYLDSAAHFSFASLYFIYVLNDDELGNPEFWVKNKVGFFGTLSGDAATTPTEQQMEHLCHAIALGKRFQSFVKTPLPEGHPPVAILVGEKHSTKVSTDLTNPDWTNNVVCEPGDGRVSLASGTGIPAGVNVTQVFKSDKVHHELMNDIPVVSAAIQSVLNLDSKKEDVSN